MRVGDEPCDRTLDHRTPSSVVRGEVALMPGPSRLDKLCVVDVDAQVLPDFDVVHRGASGHPRHRTPNVAEPLEVMATVCPAGQVTVRASRSMTKSSRSNPPGTAGRSAIALMAWVCSALRSAARVSPEP